MRPLGIALVFSGFSVSSRALEMSTLDAMQFRFEVNRGQADAASKFLARGRGFSLALTNSASVLSLDGAFAGTGLVGASRDVRLEPAELSSTRTNYLFGDDPKRWLTDVPSYGRVRYRGVY